MIAFSGVVEGQAYGNTMAEICAFLLTSFIIIANFRVMILKTMIQLRVFCSKYKAMKPRNKVKLNKQSKLIEM